MRRSALLAAQDGDALALSRAAAYRPALESLDRIGATAGHGARITALRLISAVAGHRSIIFICAGTLTAMICRQPIDGGVVGEFEPADVDAPAATGHEFLQSWRARRARSVMQRFSPVPAPAR